MARRQHRKGSPLYVTPAFELFPKSYELVKKNLSPFVILYIVPLILGLSNGAWVVDSHRHFGTDTPVAANAVGNATLPAYAWGGFGLAFLFALAIAVILKVMTQKAELDAADGKKVSLGDAWQTAKARGWQMFGLYVAVGVITVIGFILLIIPGIIMLRRYFLAPYVLLENEKMTVWQAMERSAELTRKDSWSIYSMLGVMILFALFGVLPLIGWIIAFALAFFYNVAPAIRYRELKKLG